MILVQSLLVFSLIATLSACSEQGTNGSGESATEVVEPDGIDSASLADHAWKRVMLGDTSVARLPDEPYVEYFYRKKEADLQYIRREGLVFWDTHRNDPRRYEWLLMTVGAPPVYPRDMNAWARRAAQLGPNDQPVEQSALKSWRERYPALRQEYWTSEQVTDVQRRAFWSTEIRAGLISLISARARRQDVAEERDRLVTEILDFNRTYSVPFPGDSGALTELHWLYYSVLDLALGRHDTLALSLEEQLAFFDQMREVDGIMARFYSGPRKVSADGRYRVETVIGISAHDSAEFVAASGVTTWGSDLLDQADPLPLLIYDSVIFPAQNQPLLDTELALFRVQHAEGALRFLDLSMEHWDTLSASEKVRWSGIVMNFMPGFPSGHSSNLAALRDWFGAPVDFEAMLEYEDRVFSLMEGLIESDDLEADQKDYVGNAKLFILAGQSGYFAAQNQRAMPGRREQIYLSVGEALAQAATPSALINALEYIWRVQHELGLSETRLQSILAPYADSTEERFRQFVASVLSPVELRVGTPVQIEAPTLDGLPFDTMKLEGKIVLVDHWDTNCAPCIAAMPVIHDIYEKYKDRGFEVVSIAYDGTSSRRAVDRIKERFGLTWITLNGEGLWGAMAARFGYPGYPQYMLLDRTGRWVAGTEEMGNGANLEALLNAMLTAKEAEKETATVH